MSLVHYLETDTIRVTLCSIGLKKPKKAATTRDQTQVTCKSCVQKLMKWTGNVELYAQAYSGPFIGV